MSGSKVMSPLSGTVSAGHSVTGTKEIKQLNTLANERGCTL